MFELARRRALLVSLSDFDPPVHSAGALRRRKWQLRAREATARRLGLPSRQGVVLFLLSDDFFVSDMRSPT
jgi:hypothetical protein